MKTVIFVDYENVHPKFNNLVLKENVELKVFLSKAVPKIAGAIHPALKLQTIETGASGKNALDFHIVYHLGLEIAKNPNCKYVILSKDTGFNTIALAMVKQGVEFVRTGDIAPYTADGLGDGTNQVAKKVHSAWVAWLAGRLSALKTKPKTLQGLTNCLLPSLKADRKKGLIAEAARLESSFSAFLEDLQSKGNLIFGEKRVELKLDAEPVIAPPQEPQKPESILTQWVDWLSKKVAKLPNTPKTVNALANFLCPKLAAEVKQGLIPGLNNLEKAFLNFLNNLVDTQKLIWGGKKILVAA